MNAMLILLVAIAVLVVGYVFYGGWLAKQWGIDPNRPTPAHELEDGKDYVPAAPYVVLGHHFSSIAGAGPINGPIQAAIFGWVPVLLWVLIGGIFFGAMHDFGALFASIRHKGQTLATVIAHNIDDTAKKLFCIFAYLTLILVVAAFASIVASTFAVTPVAADATAAAAATAEATNLANMRTAMISLLFIVVAVVYGVATRGRRYPHGGQRNLGHRHHRGRGGRRFQLPRHRLGQHRMDGAGGHLHPGGLGGSGVDSAAAPRLPVQLPALRHDRAGAHRHHRLRASYGRFHAIWRSPRLRASSPRTPCSMPPRARLSTTRSARPSRTRPQHRASSSRPCSSPSPAAPSPASTAWSPPAPRPSSWIGKRQAQPIGYGGMLHRVPAGGYLAVRRRLRVEQATPTGGYASPDRRLRRRPVPDARHASPASADVQGLAYALLILAVSAFCLTSLDTATRLGPLHVPGAVDPQVACEARRPDGLCARCMTNPYVATIITVVHRRVPGHDRLPPSSGRCSVPPTSCWPPWRCWPCAHGWATRAVTTRCSSCPWAFMLAATLYVAGHHRVDQGERPRRRRDYPGQRHAAYHRHPAHGACRDPGREGLQGHLRQEGREGLCGSLERRTSETSSPERSIWAPTTPRRPFFCRIRKAPLSPSGRPHLSSAILRCKKAANCGATMVCTPCGKVDGNSFLTSGERFHITTNSRLHLTNVGGCASAIRWGVV